MREFADQIHRVAVDHFMIDAGVGYEQIENRRDHVQHNNDHDGGFARSVNAGVDH